MLMKTIATGSNGNSYALMNDNEILLLDLGISEKEIKKAIDYRVSDVVGCLVTHHHLDHARSFKEFLMSGIPVYTNDETAKHFEIITGERMTGVPEKILFKCRGFTVIPFYLPHTTRDKTTNKLIPCPNFGYLVEHKEIGKLLYMTDMEYCPYTFKGMRVNHLVIECNYCQELVNSGQENYTHRLKGHCSLETCKGIIKANMTADLRTVTLIHLSDKSADEQQILKEVKEVVGCRVDVNAARRGLGVELSKYPF